MIILVVEEDVGVRGRFADPDLVSIGMSHDDAVTTAGFSIDDESAAFGVLTQVNPFKAFELLAAVFHRSTISDFAADWQVFWGCYPRHDVSPYWRSSVHAETRKSGSS
ncbi:hypothetical protein [Stieleria neptunia]|uniref:hypothetical protein n=1 Tax=Stieleria neptunia TaxID=2527979 RepID=UPI001E4DF40C|nr:hypothetical protein [Stieleria neptunia]